MICCQNDHFKQPNEKYSQKKLKIQNQNKKNKPNQNMFISKKYKQILTTQKQIYSYFKAYKGHRKDTNLLNINFKTIICKTLETLCMMKQVSLQEIKDFYIYKSSSPNFLNLINLIYSPYKIAEQPYKATGNSSKCIQISWNQKNTQSLPNNKGNINIKDDNADQNALEFRVKSRKLFERLKILFESKEIIIRIFDNDCNYLNKLLMIKYIEAIRYTIIGKGNKIKWKDLKKVLALC